MLYKSAAHNIDENNPISESREPKGTEKSQISVFYKMNLRQSGRQGKEMKRNEKEKNYEMSTHGAEDS